MPPATPKTTPIAIVGAGVFGLSTALALAERGYTNVTVFDKQDYDKSKYSYFAGCDAASAGASHHRHLPLLILPTIVFFYAPSFYLS